MRAVLVALVVVGVVLLATIEPIFSRPFDWITVVWFLAAFCLLAPIVGSAVLALVRPLWQGGLHAELDTTFWAAFVALPTCVGLLIVVVWNLLDWFGYAVD